MSPSKILFQLSGSIACYKACAAISQLVKEGHSVQTVCSPSALEFVGAATLEGLSGRPVLSEVFAPGRYMDHIHLVDWCDQAVLCPASANSLNRLAYGQAQDLIGALFLAFDRSKPYRVVPAMNTRMWEHPSTQEAIQRLKGWGVDFLYPNSGRLACGAEGVGKLAEPKEICRFLCPPPKKALKILVTGGGTSEPIDSVRVLSNRSTGRTAAQICDSLRRSGNDVMLLHAAGATLPQSKVPQKSFETAADLEQLLKQELGTSPYDAVIHLAAVSDYRVDKILLDGQSAPSSGKLGTHDSLQLILRPQAKLVDSLRAWSCSPKTRIVAFKLTHSHAEQERQAAVQRIIQRAQPDLVVHNEQSERSADSHPFRLYGPQGPLSECNGAVELAQALEAYLREEV